MKKYEKVGAKRPEPGGQSKDPDSATRNNAFDLPLDPSPLPTRVEEAALPRAGREVRRHPMSHSIPGLCRDGRAAATAATVGRGQGEAWRAARVCPATLSILRTVNCQRIVLATLRAHQEPRVAEAARAEDLPICDLRYLRYLQGIVITAPSSLVHSPLGRLRSKLRWKVVKG